MNRSSPSVTSTRPLQRSEARSKLRSHSRSAVSEPQFDPRNINERAFLYYTRLQRIQRFVKANPEEKISLREAARVSGISEAYFSSFFHQKVGVCFKDWRAHTQVQHAICLMKTHNHTITAIGLDSGFGDLRTFERVFKRHTGLTPREYKKTVRP